MAQLLEDILIPEACALEESASHHVLFGPDPMCYLGDSLLQKKKGCKALSLAINHPVGFLNEQKAYQQTVGAGDSTNSM